MGERGVERGLANLHASRDLSIAWLAHGAQTLDENRVEPDQPLAFRVGLGLEADGAAGRVDVIASKATGEMAMRIMP